MGYLLIALWAYASLYRCGIGERAVADGTGYGFFPESDTGFERVGSKRLHLEPDVSAIGFAEAMEEGLRVEPTILQRSKIISELPVVDKD